MSERITLASLAPYVPAAIVRKLAQSNGEPLPTVEEVRGACLLLDIAGFTPIVVSLSGEGPRGIDALQRLLSSYFTEMVEGVRDFGGDIYQFAGDSILACFEPERGESELELVRRAAICGAHVQRKLARFAHVELLGQRFTLSSRVGVSFGTCHRVILGEAEQWLHPALIGAPLERAVAAEKRSAGGEVILSPEAAALLPYGTPGQERDGFFRFEPPAEITPRTPQRLLTGGALALGQCSQFLHPELLRKVITTHQGFSGDFRDVTCVFVRVGMRDSHREAAELVREMNTFFTFAQRESSLYRGVLLMPDFTDKGNVLYVVFGAPTAQENKEQLACHFAAKLLREQAAFPFIEDLRIGIATGPAYWGEMGAPARKGSWALGEVVNIAARLMAHAREPGIQVDANTQRKLHQEFSTLHVEDAKLKGISRVVPVYRVQSDAQPVRSLLVRGQGEIVGRRDELHLLTQAVEESIEGMGRICVVSGEAGIGKSRLSSRLVEEAEKRGARTLYGICYSYETFTPFFPWKEVLVQLFQMHEGDEPEARLERLRREFEGLEDVGQEWALVLAGIMGLPVVEDERTQVLDARQKNQQVFNIIYQLLMKRSATTPLLLFFEDLHWADHITLDLIEHIAHRLGPMRLTLLVTMRPGEALRELRSMDCFRMVELSQLNEQEARALVRLHLKLAPPNIGLEDMLLGKVQGNPFFIESLVEGLVEQGLLEEGEGGRRVLRRSLQSIRIPDSIQDVVLNRIDLLPELEKLIVKVASVIGRIFTLDAVHALLPTSIDLDEARRAMAALANLGLILLEVEEPYTCLFKHIVIRDVAYNTLLVSAREHLHRKLARFLEEKDADNPVKPAGILAYHYLAGNDELKGLEYTLQAARAAKAQYANEEAIHHYNRAMEVLSTTDALDREVIYTRTREVMQELAEALLQAGNYAAAIQMYEQLQGDEVSDERRAEIHIGLGRAFQEKGESGRAIQELESALQLLGRPPPRSMVRLVLRTGVQMGIHLLSLVLPQILRPVPPQRLPLYIKQLNTLISLIRIYYFADLAKLTWATLLAFNMATRSRSDYGLSQASGYYGTMLFGAGLLKRSMRYLGEALEFGRRSQDAVAQGIAMSRLGTNALFANELEVSARVEEEAIGRLRQVGERWEVQTSMMILGTSQFLSSQFETAEKSFRKMGELGLELNAKMHQAWAHAWVSMCRYLQGEGEVAQLCEELEKGLRISIEVDDLANQCACLNHLANIAVREGQVEEAARVAVRAFDTVWKYQVLVPFLQIGLVDAAEAALFALENGARSVPRGKLLRIVRLGCFKARALSRIYPYMKGPALRVTARALRLRKGVAAAEPVFQQAIELLEAGPNRWEAGVAYLDGAVAVPHRRAQWLARAREIFTAIGARAELRRVERLEASSVSLPGAPVALPASASADALRL
ncbi:AAA family ATPase [Hyalangium rubrum]|uniref:AAA family ATPase n=1 Tax=Hyalangium rubrum TaxID=3103134 RepID=A0ABU5H9Y2_9BACT|nr:AAA family ATPase [Hyalangium sp. s54d21]MDY7229633.1 AAA family ATPase [Hyalangium sp. s54d21]